jgi:hypothetical protein
VKLRISEIKQAVQVFINNPIFGTGPELIYTELLKYRPEWINSTYMEWDLRPSNIRNNYIEILGTTGILGFVIYILLIFNYLKNLYRSKLDEQVVPFAVISLVFLIWSMFYHQTPTLIFLFAISSGLTLSSFNSKNKSKGQSQGRTRRGKFILPLLSISTFFLILNTYTVYSLSKADTLLEKTYEIEISQESHVLLTESVENAPYILQYRREFIFREYQRLRKLNKDSKQFKIILDDILENSQYLYELSPHDSKNLQFLGTNYYNLYLLTGKDKYLEIARIRYLDASNIEPLNPSHYDNLGQTYWAEDRYKQAIHYLTLAIDRKEDYWGSYLHRGDVYLLDGQYDKAKKDFVTVIEADTASDTQKRYAHQSLEDAVNEEFFNQ